MGARVSSRVADVQLILHREDNATSSDSSERMSSVPSGSITSTTNVEVDRQLGHIASRTVMNGHQTGPGTVSGLQRIAAEDQQIISADAVSVELDTIPPSIPLEEGIHTTISSNGTAAQAIHAGSITYTTSVGTDGHVVYHCYQAVPASFAYSGGIMDGLQWVPIEITPAILDRIVTLRGGQHRSRDRRGKNRYLSNRMTNELKHGHERQRDQEYATKERSMHFHRNQLSRHSSEANFSTWFKSPASHASSAATAMLSIPSRPECFSRPVKATLPYTHCNTIKIQDMEEFLKVIPPMPLVLVSHDVYNDDWLRLANDLSLAWCSKLPLLFDPTGRLPTRTAVVADIINVWNAMFFLRRGVELVLYKGRKRRTGRDIGTVDMELPGFETQDIPSPSMSDSLIYVGNNSDSRSVSRHFEHQRKAMMKAVYALYVTYGEMT